jgi:hypothetical protein
MRRVGELVAAVRSVYPHDPFFARFAESCRNNPQKAKIYCTYEDALRWLDPDSWATLKGKAVAHFRDHRPGQLKQGFFNQLNEAFAYRHLARRGYGGVRMLPETGRQVPDLEYFEGRQRLSCEVKTVGRSDEEVFRRGSREAFANVYLHLSDGFFRKLRSTIAVARSQIQSRSTKGMAYLVMIPDDMVLDNYDSYRRAVAAFARAEDVVDVYIKFDVRFNRHMQLRGRLTSA